MFQRNVFLTLEEEMNVSLTCLSMKFIYDICFKICVKELFKEVMLIFGFDFQDMPRSDVEFAVPRG